MRVNILDKFFAGRRSFRHEEDRRESRPQAVDVGSTALIAGVTMWSWRPHMESPGTQKALHQVKPFSIAATAAAFLAGMVCCLARCRVF